VEDESLNVCTGEKGGGRIKGIENEGEKKRTL
jgi:hypothetical protein